jgi:hypothetical protein
MNPISTLQPYFSINLSAYAFRVISSIQAFQPKVCTHFSSPPCALLAPPIPSSLIAEEYILWSSSSCLKARLSFHAARRLRFASSIPQPSRGHGHFAQGELPLANCTRSQPFPLSLTPSAPPRGGACLKFIPLDLDAMFEGGVEPHPLLIPGACFILKPSALGEQRHKSCTVGFPHNETVRIPDIGVTFYQ